MRVTKFFFHSSIGNRQFAVVNPRTDRIWDVPNKLMYNYISTDEVEMYCHRSRNRYFMVTKLRNYSATAEATMTKFKLSSKAISLGANPKKELSRYTGYWDIRPERQAPKGLNSYFFHFISFRFLFLFLFFLKIMCFVHHITGRRYRAIKLIFCIRIEERRAFQETLNEYIQSRGFGNRGYKP